LQHQIKGLDKLDFNNCTFQNKFYQKTNINAFNNNLKMRSENTQEKSTIIKNLFIKNYDQTNNKNITTLHKSINYFYNSINNDTNIEDRNKMMNKIINKINSLDDSIKLSFDMHRSGYNYYEISTCLNIPLETVKERVQYARKVVRESILENCSDYPALSSLTA